MKLRSDHTRPFRRTWAPAVVFALALSTLPALSPAPAAAAAPTQSPTILAPLPGETVNANPRLVWSAVAGASKYVVQVSSSSTFATGYGIFTYNPQPTASTRATIPADLPLGTVYWRVAATDTNGAVGPFETSSFERVWADAPQLTQPANGSVLTYPDDAVSFEWEPMPGAKTYEVQVDDDENFTTPDDYTTVNPGLTLREPQTVEQPFYWRARAVATSGMNSAWSESRSYSIVWPDVPTLTYPQNQTSPPITDVIFDWEPVEGAATYQLQVSPNGDFTNNVALNVSVKGTRYSPPVTLNNSDYYWRVRARDAKTPEPNLGGWSEVRQFQRGWLQRPQLLAPADEATVTTNPTFEWDGVPHASHYQIEVSTDVNFSNAMATQSCVTTHTSYTPYLLADPASPQQAQEAGICPLKINIGQRYYWHVRALDGPLNLFFPAPVNGLWSNFGSSDTYSFTFEPPVPLPSAPADGATVHTPTLEWNFVPGQGQYRVYIFSESGTKEVDILTHATSYTPTKRLMPGKYKWFVLSENATSGQGINRLSLHRTFTLAAPTQTSTSPAPLAPEDGALTTRMPQLRWQPVTGAHHYRVWYRPNSGNFSELSNEQVPFASFTDPGVPLSPGIYQWYVTAHTQLGAEIETGPPSVRSFVIDQLGLTEYVGPCSQGVSCVVGDTPTLRWNHVDRAGSYRVYIAVDPNFTNIIREYRTVFNELRPREALVDSQAGQSFYWFVRPCMSPDSPATSPCGPFNSEVQPRAFAFRKQSAPAQQLTPAANAAVADEVTFTWNDYLATSKAQTPSVTQEARKYRIQVSTANTFASLLDEDYVDQMTYTPSDKTYPEGPVFWRVQAIDGSGNPLTFSATRQLTKSSPPVQPLVPQSGATVDRVPTFRWEPLPFAARYEVEVYKDADTLYSASNRVASAVQFNATKLTGWTPQTSLPAGVYAWRVRRQDVDSRPGVWSGGGTFTIAPPVPELGSPANGAVVLDDDLEFSWAVSNAAVQYRFQSSTNPSFDPPFETQLTATPAWAPTRQYPDGTYYWRVQVLDSASNVVGTTATRTFSKQTPMTTKLTTSVFPASVIDAGATVVSGTLLRTDKPGPLANRTVEVLGRYATSSTYKVLGRVTTDWQGNYSFRHSPRRFWVYQVRFPTNGVVGGSVSTRPLVKYQPMMQTAMSHIEIRKGDRTKLVGSISPYFRGRRILLQHLSSTGRWRTITSRELGRPASTTPRVTKFAFVISGRTLGFKYYRAKFPSRRNVNLGVVGPGLVVRVS